MSKVYLIEGCSGSHEDEVKWIAFASLSDKFIKDKFEELNEGLMLLGLHSEDFRNAFKLESFQRTLDSRARHSMDGIQYKILSIELS